MMQTIVQLGWLQDAIDWLFNKILSPVFNWLSDLLSTVFEWVFNNILLPILQVLFEKLLKIAIQLIWKILATFLYTILKGLLSIVEMLEESFSVLAGTKEVTVSGAKGPLLTVLVNSGLVRNTILITILIAFILCFLFAVFGVLRSIADMEGQQNRPVGQVLRLTLQAVIRMLLVPVMALMLIMLGDAILKSIQLAMNPGGSS
ncbi:MAG: hypothetical protein IJT34_00215, partial [Butyrivibrio sp.]|nr:hypothetical protein [Butyrivibrio sp.]